MDLSLHLNLSIAVLMLENAIGMRIKMYSGFIDFIMKNICLIIYSLAIICVLDKHTKIKSMISHENKK